MMNIGTAFDWMGRIFGIAFLLFLLSVLFFPSWSDPDDNTPTSTGASPGAEDDWNARAGAHGHGHGHSPTQPQQRTGAQAQENENEQEQEHIAAR